PCVSLYVPGGWSGRCGAGLDARRIPPRESGHGTSSPGPTACRVLFRIAQNVALDNARQRRRDPEGSQPAVLLGKMASPETTVAVNEALGTLADLDRDVFLMRELAGLGYDEIATGCDLTSGAVRSRIHRARL